MAAQSSDAVDAALKSVGKDAASGRFSHIRRIDRKGETMKGSAIGIVGAACLLVGFGAGFALRPVISPVTASPAVAAGVAQPTEEEATAAVRRHRLFTGTSLSNATLKLGDCSPGGVGPGVTCMTQLVMDSTKPNAAPQNRPIGFARVNGQWEVAVW
ncbi:hypothetical protein [Phenylobacterium sp.]|uniref:hypothetical protein n=1 Tax=Phenylobacterium sp. TaxID=1871053 RepID=UPI0025DD7909|nr:hypothetical protein [Phenylobacterium sp.]MBX3482860.1 hypothetical protein [Phenylobacterium sp.]